MFCPYCGSQTPDKGKFCINCGKKLDNSFIQMEISTDVQTIESDTTNQLFDTNNISIITDNAILDIELIDKQKFNYFKMHYFNNGKFHFPLGKYTIVYNEDVIMSINIMTYFIYVREDTINYCQKEYQRKIHGWESLIKNIGNIYDECMDRIASLSARLMVASGIMSYTEEMIQDSLFMGTKSALGSIFEDCAEKFQNVMSKYNTAETIRELNHSLSSDSNFFAGGFGFEGVLGGMAAAGIANATSSLIDGIKNNMSKTANESQMQNELNAISKNPDILESFLEDIGQATQQAFLLYRQAYEIEYNTQFIAYFDKKMISIANNTIRYVKDKEIILKNLSEALTLVPSMTEALICLANNFYDNQEISEQLLVLSDFLLQKEIIENHLQKMKEDDLEEIFNLSEKTINDISKKIELLSEKSKRLSYNASEELQRLQNIKLKKQSEEKAYQEHKIKLENLINDCKVSAKKVDDALKTNNIMKIGEMSANGDMIAEERYIQYYVTRIQKENDKRLFDAIANQCGKNRAYDCIIGICCFNGYGTIINIEIAKELLLRSANLECTYAIGYLARLVITKKTDVWEEELAWKYFKSALDKMSPYVCAWNGKLLCQGTAEGGSNTIPNDYDKALFYTEFAYNCGIEEAAEVYNYLHKHLPEEINAKKYTSDSECYITTAVCNSFGKADDCYELVMLRNFRDFYLLKTECGEQLVKEYYCMAPKIVKKIDQLPERDNIYLEIWETYLQHCIKFIQTNELEACKNLYVKMVKQLENTFL